MAHQSLVSYDARLEDLPFSIPQALLSSVLVSRNFVETLNNAEEFMTIKDYRTSATLFTIALQQIQAAPQLVVTILCKRAECLLHMNYVQYVLQDCEVAVRMIGGADEHIAFLILRALELQGEVQKAFGHAVIYEALDPELRRDQSAVSRLRSKVQRLCVQGDHQVFRTISLLMTNGKILFQNGETKVALNIFTEVLCLFPGVLEAHEYRALCFFVLGDPSEAKNACYRALDLSQRTSSVAFDILLKIEMQRGQLKEALKLVKEWRTVDPKNEELDRTEMNIDAKMQGLQNTTGINQSQSMLHLPVIDVAGVPHEAIRISAVKPKRGKDFQRQDSLGEKNKADTQEGKELEATYRKDAGAVAPEHIPSELQPPKLPSERSKKKKRRRKTRNLERARKEATDDDSDASSVCSISTCPGDLDFRRDALHRPKMPIFEDSELDQGAVSDQPKSSSVQRVPAHEPPKSSNTEISRIRRRPPGVKTAYQLCRYYKRTGKICFQGKLCVYAHSEEERKAWEKERKQDYRNKIAQERKAKMDKERSQKQSSNKRTGGFRPRPLAVYGAYRLCPHYLLRRACPSGISECRFAHSEAERKAWEEERAKAFSKSTTKQKKAATRKESGSSSLSLKEFRRAFRGQCRAPLRILNKGGKYRMCPEWTKGTCKLGRACPYAHGEKELTAWNEHLSKMEKELKRKETERKKEKEKNKKKEAVEENKEHEDVSSLEKNVVCSPINDEPSTPTYELEELVSSLPGVTVLCEPSDLDVSLQIPLDSEGEKAYNWTLRVFYESSVSGHLQDVVLLPQYHKCYTLSSIRFNVKSPSGSSPKRVAKGPHTEELTDEFHHRVESHLRSLQGSCEVEIVVAFSTMVFGSFTQVLALDFGKGSAPLAVEMNIEVGSQEFLQEFCEDKSQLALDWTPWDDGSHEIITFEPKQPPVFNNGQLIDRYKLPKAEDVVPCPLLDKAQGLSPKNYVDVMHQLLFVEEVYIRKQIASFNMQGAILHATNMIVKKDGFARAGEDWLYGSFHVSRPITPDDAQGRLLFRNFGSVLKTDAQGRLLFRSFGSVLIAKSQQDSVVYEALVDSVEDRRVMLILSKRCCKEMDLSHNTFVTVDIQFHINRLPLCEMHDNIDRLGPEHFRILFPELSSAVLEEKVHPLPWILDPKLSEDQKEIIKKIAAPAIDAPPLVVFGPFGTGKTFTLNQAIRRISVNQNNRVLLCTHSNSAADLHVSLLDIYLKKQHGITACKPLRIYTPLRKLSTISDTVKEYCLIADRGTPAQAIRLPTRDDVIRHRVVVCTLSMSRALFDMDLHGKYFSHILIDEAAQALETETLTPLTLAGNNTKLVFTGDHMQMSPDVFSPQAKKWGFQISLQERLFYDYKKRQDGSKLDPNLVLLAENYRSNERVLQFSSDMFYGGELSSGTDQPLHPQFGPLVFYAALGREEIEASNESYRNLAEVNEIVKRVKELSDCWPVKWGTRDLKQIGVVSSYHYQVKTIRDGLRKIGLEAVDVESIENVQGKEFRALFVSTVRTVHTCIAPRDPETGKTESPYLYFLSDPKLLNTALTRAQSLIAVVGDPFSLRTIGDCQGVWEEFIKRCSDDGQLFGIEHHDLEECISLSGLNVNAAAFVPTATTDSNQPPALNDDLLSCNSSFATQQDDPDCQEISHFPLRDASDEDDETEHSSKSDFEDAGDEMSESDNFGNADDFAEYDNVDETVPPKYMDPIIQALKEKCEEKKIKRKLRDEVKCEGNEVSEEMIPAPLDDKENSKSFYFNTTGSKMVHEDIEMTTKNGKTVLTLVNFKYKYSERSERLLRPPKLQDQERLRPEYLQRLLQDDPELYRECTLRVTWDGARTSYGELEAAEDEDILIEENPRQTFDQDAVVVKLSQKPSTDVPAASEGMKGTVIGVLHRGINLRERQFVCTVSRDDPGLMLPINKLMTPIANLTDESCKGVPIYRKIEPDSDEKAVRVRTLPLKEALSGKFFFVVQYLQWRRQFPFPLGIVTKTIRRGNDLPDTFKVLTAEYKLKEEFPEEVAREVKRCIHKWSSIPHRERTSRRLVQKAFTIDPPGSKALDDALTIENLGNDRWKVGVHIADVSYYVPVGSKIDDEARARGASYAGGNRYGDVLMLPAPLSHDICSLLPNEERLAVSVYLTLDQDGRIQDDREIDFCRSIVTSQCRLTYAQAQQVILHKPVHCRHEDGQLTPEIRQSILSLNVLAQKRRKVRLLGGSHFHFNHADRNYHLEAHELVEEMMILANCAVGKYLVEKKADLSPLRIQRPPKTRKMNEWREKFGNCARLSLFLKRHLNEPENGQLVEAFFVPPSTWRLISEARRTGDQRKLNLLICNDNIYPQLAIAHSFLNAVQRKAEDVIAAEVTVNDRQHWSLNVREYTRFTSPIRRYLDIVAHRLLFELAGQEVVADDTAKCYRRCSFLSDKSSKFEKDCARAEVAAKLSKGSCEFSAFVELVEEDFIRIQLSPDANQYLSSTQRQIQMSHLGPIEQPELNKTSGNLELKWKLRIYNASVENIKRAKRSRNQDRHLIEDRIRMQALFSVNSSNFRSGYRIRSILWLDLLDAVKANDESRISRLLEDLDKTVARQRKEMSRVTYETEERINNFFVQQLTRKEAEDERGDSVSEENRDGTDYDRNEDDDDNDVSDDESDYREEEGEEEEGQYKGEEQKGGEDTSFACEVEGGDAAVHFIETSLTLKVTDSVTVQLSANGSAGIMSPEIQLFNLAPGIDICLEHRKLPDKCFSTAASDKASQPSYRSITSYVHLWRPVLDMEAATVAVRNDDTMTLKDLEVTWRKDEDDKFYGEFQLHKNYSKSRQIDIFPGDYACVKVHCQSDGQDENSKKTEGDVVVAHACDMSSGERGNDATASEREDGMQSTVTKSYWVGHCIFTLADPSLADNSVMKYTLKLFQNSMKVPDELDTRDVWVCTVEIIKQTIPSRRMISTLIGLPKMKQPGRETPLSHDICLGKALRLPVLRIRLPSDRPSIVDHVNSCNMRRLNNSQVAAVREALRRRFTLIQGPPGTGKTMTGVHIAYWFMEINHKDSYRGKNPQDTPKQETPEKAPPQVLYCGPSNKSVDVVADYLIGIPGIEQKVLRVYGNVIEEEEFPIPNQVKQIRKTALYEVPEKLKRVALHHVIRDKKRSPFARELKKCEQKFAKLKKAKKTVEDRDVEEYLKLIQKAEQWVIRSVCQGHYYQVVLCTCSTAGSKRVRESCNNTNQCIVDESAMCLEPETIVPIAWSQAKQVVLIGDHMQLQPIVMNRVARSLGLNRSLFERYCYNALMLEDQYRMHKAICEFPSKHFYEGRLKTANSVKERERKSGDSRKFVEFWPSHFGRDYPLAFCNVVGKEEELVVTTDEGNQRSKSNIKEKDKVVEVIKRLIDCGVTKNQIMVLSPYRAQCHLIEQDLNNQQLSEIQVMSIVKSQGSESDFVIISLVRSLPGSQINHEPSGGWLRENLGFVTDEHQINVALTRAKRGLCIIGNKNLLGVCEMWSCLIDHYRTKECLVDGDHWPGP